MVQSPVSDRTRAAESSKNPNTSATTVLAGEMGAAPAGLSSLAGSGSPEPPVVGCWSPWSLVRLGAAAQDILKKGKKGAEGCRGESQEITQIFV